MARRDLSKRAERVARSERRLNSALTVFIIGFVAEFYLLQVSRFYLKGSVEQLLATATYLETMVYVGLGILAVGLVLFSQRAKKAWFVKASVCLTGLGVFLAFSSQLMRKVYPGGTTAMCVIVPVLTLMSVVYLLYPAEFSVEATALVAAVGCAALINRDPAGTALSLKVKLLVVLCLALCAAALLGTRWLQKRGGVFENGEKKLPVFSAKTNYALVYAVLCVSIAAILVALLVPGAAYFILWGGAIALFLLAVLHTVKML